MTKPPIIGASLPRLDAREKVTGKAVYADDIKMDNMLHGALLRSPYPHALIKRIDVSKAKSLRGVKDVVVGTDTPQIKYGNWRLIPESQDEYALAVDRVRFVGDEVAAVCALDRDTAERALELIEVEYEELPAMYTVEDSMSEGAIPIHDYCPSNVSVVREIKYGDTEEAFARSEYIREDVFTTHPVSHAYLEPCSCVAAPDEGGRVTLWTSTQAPYIVQCLLAKTLSIPENYVRVIKPAVGGAFGGKMELRSWEFCAAFMAMRTGRPVKFTISREDEFAYGRRRHSVTIKSKLGMTKEGLTLARDFSVLLNGGAYNSMGHTATFLCGIFGDMLYKFQAYRYRGQHVYTNTQPAGAMRGFGAPQALFACESQMNMAAEELGIDPIELRIRNAIESGHVVPGVTTIGSCGFKESLIEVRKISGWDEKRKQRKSGRGVGIGCYSFISGGVFNWFDTKHNFSSAEVRLFDDGTAHLLTMASDIGQGSDLVLRQILAAELGIDISKIRLTAADTAMTPKADLGTWGSRVTMMAGNAVLEAAKKIKEMLIPVPFLEYDLNQIHDIGFAGERVFVKARPEKGMSLAECASKAIRSRRGEPLTAFGYYTPRSAGLLSPAYSFGAQVAEVDVDQETGSIRINKVYTAHDCGVMINEMAVEGQLQGSIHMGLGYATCEDLVIKDGVVQNRSFLDYKMFTAQDMPQEQSVAIETYEQAGPFGAKEAGEGLVSPTAPAVIDAVYHATGYRCQDLPVTPEKIVAALHNRQS